MAAKENNVIENLDGIFKLYSEIKLVYFFGSRARGEDGPLSDYDFAVYLEEKDPKKRFETQLKLLAQLTKELKTNDVDLCVLNDTERPELNYNIIKDSKLIYEKEPFKVLVEPQILNEYFDFIYLLRKYNLTKA